MFPLNLRIDRAEPAAVRPRRREAHDQVGRGNGRDDYLDNFWPQASSQWDSLRHIRHPAMASTTASPREEIVGGGGKLGIENMAQRGIAGRGVLLDVARYLGVAGRAARLRDVGGDRQGRRWKPAAQRRASRCGPATSCWSALAGWVVLERGDAGAEADDGGHAMTQLQAPGIGPRRGDGGVAVGPARGGCRSGQPGAGGVAAAAETGAASCTTA